jgi:signal transduction histidine kinase
LALIDDILDVSKVDAGQLRLHEEWIDVGHAVRSCIHLMDIHAARASVRLESAVPDDLRLWADDRRVRQILLNLVSNAVKFTPEGGRVRVSARAGSDGTALVVSDAGIGMSEKDIPIALSRFGQIDSSLSRKHTGTGLGLSLTKGLAELHGGTIDIVSKPGVGTTVTVNFPSERTARFREAA